MHTLFVTLHHVCSQLPMCYSHIAELRQINTHLSYHNFLGAWYQRKEDSQSLQWCQSHESLVRSHYSALLMVMLTSALEQLFFYLWVGFERNALHGQLCDCITQPFRQASSVWANSTCSINCLVWWGKCISHPFLLRALPVHIELICLSEFLQSISL